MSVKERVIRQLEKLDEARLGALEQQLAEELGAPERQLRAWRSIYGLLSDPEDYAAFEKASRRRSLFGGRTLNLEPDDESNSTP